MLGTARYRSASRSNTVTPLAARPESYFSLGHADPWICSMFGFVGLQYSPRHADQAAMAAAVHCNLTRRPQTRPARSFLEIARAESVGGGRAVCTPSPCVSRKSSINGLPLLELSPIAGLASTHSGAAVDVYFEAQSRRMQRLPPESP